MTLYSDCQCCDGLFELQHLRRYRGGVRCCGCIELEGEDPEDYEPVSVADLDDEEVSF